MPAGGWFGPSRRHSVTVRLGEAGLVAFASRHAADFAMPEMEHPFSKLVLVCTGMGQLITRANSDGSPSASALVAGDALWVPAGTRHRLVDESGQPMRLLGVCAVDPQPDAPEAGLIKELLRHLRPSVPRAVEDGGAERVLRQLLFEQTESRPGQVAALRALWIQLLVVLLRALVRLECSDRLTEHRTGESRMIGVVRALAWLDEHWHLPVSSAELAKRAGVPERTFSGQVRRLTGTTVKVRLHRLRLAHAERLLRAGSPVLDAALSAGYSDLGHFYRVFRAAHGIAPARWRSQSGGP